MLYRYHILYPLSHLSFFFFNDTPTTEIYTLSLHDALPILPIEKQPASHYFTDHEVVYWRSSWSPDATAFAFKCRSEEHTSELQSQSNLVCRLLLEKKKKNIKLQT